MSNNNSTPFESLPSHPPCIKTLVMNILHRSSHFFPTLHISFVSHKSRKYNECLTIFVQVLSAVRDPIRDHCPLLICVHRGWDGQASQAYKLRASSVRKVQVIHDKESFCSCLACARCMFWRLLQLLYGFKSAWNVNAICWWYRIRFFIVVEEKRCVLEFHFEN